MWSCLQRPKGSPLLWEAGLEQAADSSNLMCLKGMIFKYSANYKILSFFHSRHSTIRVSSNEVRCPSPVWPPLSVLLPLLCAKSHLWSGHHQNHYLCSSGKSFSLVAVFIRKRLKDWKKQNLDLLVFHALPQTPGFPFSGAQALSLHLSLKALQRCSSPWAGCKTLWSFCSLSLTDCNNNWASSISRSWHISSGLIPRPRGWRNTDFLPSGSSSSSFHRTERMGKILSGLSMHGWILPVRTCFYSSHAFVTPSMKDLIDWNANAVKVLTCVIFLF